MPRITSNTDGRISVAPPFGVDDETFFKQLSQEDPLGVVLRGVIHIDHELMALINEASATPRAINHSAFDYHQRVMIAVAVGLNPAFSKPLNAVGTLRNKFAHEPNFPFGAAQVNPIYQALSGDHKEIVQETFRSVRAKHPKGNFAGSFSGLDPLDKMVFLLISLRQALRAGRAQIAHGYLPSPKED